MNSNSPHFSWPEVRRRRLLPVLAGWFGACWALIEFSSFLVDRYALPESLIDGVFLGMWTLLPAVLLVSWWIGAEGAMRWSMARAAAAGGLALAGLVVLPLAPRIQGDGQPLIDSKSVAATSSVDKPEVVPTSFANLPRVLLFSFKQPDDDDGTRWLSDAMPILVEYDLLFDSRLDAASAATTRFYELLASVRAQGGDELDQASMAVLRHASVAIGYNAMVTGSIAESAGGLTVSATILQLKPDRDLGTIEFEARDVWAAVDGVAAAVRERLASADPALSANDPALASITTDSIDALRAYVKASKAGITENNPGKAIELLTASKASDPSFAAADLLRFKMHGALRENTAANEIADALMPRVSMLPDRERFSLQAYRAYASGDPERGRAVYELWASQAPHVREPKLTLAHLDLVFNPEDEAAWQTRYRLARESGSARERLYLSRASLTRDEPEVAREFALLARELDPFEVGIPLQLGEIAKVQGRFADAERFADEAGLMRPEMISPLLLTASVKLATGQWEQALQFIEQARARSSNNPAAQAQVLRDQIVLLQDLERHHAAYEVLMELVEVERKTFREAELAGRFAGYVGLYARTQGAEAARTWLTQWDSSPDESWRAYGRLSWDRDIAMEMDDIDGFLDAIEKLDALGKANGWPVQPISLAYAAIGRAWKNGSEDDLLALEVEIRRVQASFAAAGSNTAPFASWRRMMVGLGILHRHPEFAERWLEPLMLSTPESPRVLWLGAQTAMLTDNETLAGQRVSALREPWADADPSSKAVIEWRALATELGVAIR